MVQSFPSDSFCLLPGASNFPFLFGSQRFVDLVYDQSLSPRAVTGFGISPRGHSSGYGGRNRHFTFEIKLDLDRPGELALEDEILEREEIPLAA